MGEGEVVNTLGSLPDVLTAVWTHMTGLVGEIKTAPLLLVGVGFTFAFGIVKISKKLMRRK